MSLKDYRRKRDFGVTPEPKGEGRARAIPQRRFVIQKHDATRLHYDLRLELGRTLVSWAVPKGIPFGRGEKRLAVKVEDHPLSYYDFEGVIPKGEYGGGTVQVWDLGVFEPLVPHPVKALKEGKLHFVLHGTKLNGEWTLVRMREEENQWLLIRGGSDHPPLSRTAANRSALSGMTMAEIRRNRSEPTPGFKTLNPNEVAFIKPMKARLVEKPLEGEWLYEVKFDGYRALAYKQGEAVCLLSRNQHDLTPRFPEVAEVIAGLSARQCVIDGEVVALDAEGRPSFQLLQAEDPVEARPPIRYYVFDLPSWNGESLLHWPLEKRRAKLRSLLPAESEVVRFSASLNSDVKTLLGKAAELRLEGLIGKRAGSHYEPGRRSGAWIKLKLINQQEFVIGGFTEPGGTRSSFGAILVGYYESGKLLYAGKVGSGFSEAGLKDLHRRFGRLAIADCPFANLPEARARRGSGFGEAMTASVMKRCHWVKPHLVAQIRFAEWTRDGRLRQPVFLGLRSDKPAKAIVRESAV